MTEPRVLDLTVDLSGMYATRLLADQGWDVSRIDIPETSTFWSHLDGAGVPRQGLLSIDYHLNRNKRRTTVDIMAPDGRNRLQELANSVDFIVESIPTQLPASDQLTYRDLQRMNPGATVVSVSPYGRTGPYRNLIATDRTLWAHSGAMFLCGRSDEEPMAPNVPIVSYLGGLYACIAVLAEQIRRDRLSAQADVGRHLDISLLDSMSANLERATTYYSYLQSIALRGSASRRYFGGYPAGPYRARDGYFMLVPGHQPVSTVALLIDRPELIDHPLFNDRPARIREAAAFDDLILGPLLERDVDDLVRLAADLRMPCARILEIDELMADEQLEYRRAIRTRADGSVHIEEPWRFVADDLPARPPLDQPALLREGESPLAGMRVLDLTKAYAGPTASRILAELGAEVIKVESTDHLDIVPRGLIPCDNAPGDEWWERSGFFADRNLGKLGITLKLDDPAGRDIALELVRRSDVAIWNFSPRVMDNLGLSFATLRTANPDIVLTAMSGYGYSGPGRNQYALAATMEAASGWTSQMRYRDGDTPMLLGFSLLDALSGIYAAAATLFALERRARTGAPAVIDFAARESAIPFLAFPLTDLVQGITPSVERESLTEGGTHICLKTEGLERWVEVFVPDARRTDFVRLLGGTLGDSADWRNAARTLAAAWTQTRLVEALQRERFAAAPVVDGEQVLLDEHLAARHLFHLVDRPTGVGVRPHARQLPGLVDGAPLAITPGPPPRVAEHNDQVFLELLGLSDQQVEALREAHVIGSGPAGRLPDAWKKPLPLDEMVAYGAIVRVPDAFQKMQERFGAPIGGQAPANSG